MCKGYVAGKDHHCVWLDSCVSASNTGLFLLFLCLLAATLAQYAAILLTSACAGTRLLWGGRLLVPTDCSSFNPKFEGDPGLAVACGAHAALLAVPVCALAGNMTWKIARRKMY